MRKTLTAAAMVLALAATGCTTSKDNANTQKYPQEAKDNFVASCVATAKKTSPGGDDKKLHDTCKCVIDKLEAKLPYDRKDPAINSFKDADSAIKKGTPLPASIRDDIDKATADCRK